MFQALALRQSYGEGLTLETSAATLFNRRSTTVSSETYPPLNILISTFYLEIDFSGYNYSSILSDYWWKCEKK